jgi:ribosomal protein S18 acetylase RimI-like enzyme
MPLPLSERYLVTPLDSRHDRDAFRCGVEALDRYLREQAGQDVRRFVGTVLVAEERFTRGVHGFYTLSMAGVQVDCLPETLQKKMPRYPSLPAVRLGRLAVALEARGTGLGRYLLMDAMARSVRSEIAWALFVVDAKDDQARSFYARYGFQSLLDDPNHLYVSRRTIEPHLQGGR